MELKTLYEHSSEWYRSHLKDIHGGSGTQANARKVLKRRMKSKMAKLSRRRNRK